MEKNHKIIIIVVVVIIVVIIIYLIGRKNTRYYERFSKNNRLNPQFLNNPDPATADITDLLIDKQVCDPSCCGDQWPVPFDGMTPTEIQKTISVINAPGQHVRTNFTCARGTNGVGCPCVSKKAYMNLVNRGQGDLNTDQIEPTFLINSEVDIMSTQPMWISEEQDTRFTKNMESNRQMGESNRQMGESNRQMREPNRQMGELKREIKKEVGELKRDVRDVANELRGDLSAGARNAKDSIFDEIQKSKSFYTNERKINDLDLQRLPQSLNNLKDTITSLFRK